MSVKVISVGDKLGLFNETWTPKRIAQLNNHEIKVAKFEGEFVWHSHEHTDELFWVIKGELEIAIKDQDNVVLGPGDICIIPKKVEHKPMCRSLCEVVLIELLDTLNTGNVKDSDLTCDEVESL